MTTPGRWSCPDCHVTVTITASAADAHVAIDAIQRRHATEHRTLRRAWS